MGNPTYRLVLDYNERVRLRPPLPVSPLLLCLLPGHGLLLEHPGQALLHPQSGVVVHPAKAPKVDHGTDRGHRPSIASSSS